jgi:hypothetical protein
MQAHRLITTPTNQNNSFNPRTKPRTMGMEFQTSALAGRCSAAEVDWIDAGTRSARDIYRNKNFGS